MLTNSNVAKMNTFQSSSYNEISEMIYYKSNMESKPNIFFYAPKELTTYAFLVWLIYFLDSSKEYKEH